MSATWRPVKYFFENTSKTPRLHTSLATCTMPFINMYPDLYLVVCKKENKLKQNCWQNCLQQIQHCLVCSVCLFSDLMNYLGQKTQQTQNPSMDQQLEPQLLHEKLQHHAFRDLWGRWVFHPKPQHSWLLFIWFQFQQSLASVPTPVKNVFFFYLPKAFCLFSQKFRCKCDWVSEGHTTPHKNTSSTTTSVHNQPTKETSRFYHKASV